MCIRVNIIWKINRTCWKLPQTKALLMGWERLKRWPCVFVFSIQTDMFIDTSFFDSLYFSTFFCCSFQSLILLVNAMPVSWLPSQSLLVQMSNVNVSSSCVARFYVKTQQPEVVPRRKQSARRLFTPLLFRLRVLLHCSGFVCFFSYSIFFCKSKWGEEGGLYRNTFLRSVSSRVFMCDLCC